MYLKEFKNSPSKKIKKLNNMLSEQFGITIKTNFPSKGKLEKLAESAELALLKLRGTGKKFHLEPEYAKFLCIHDIVETMLSEGMYANSPMHEAMCEMIKETVRNLMDSGYTMDEAVGECMNRYRMDNRFAYDDEYVMPIVITSAKDYMDECSMTTAAIESAVTDGPVTTLNDRLLRELARECGVDLTDTTSYAAIEEKLDSFAKVSGKSRDSVVGFLNGLDEAALLAGIQMFGRKIGEANAFVKARKDAIKAGKKEFDVDGKTYKVTGDTSDEIEEAKNPYAVGMASAMKSTGDKPPLSKKTIKKAHKIAKAVASNESMFDDIINDMINEEVDVEQAEVVMAVRALADDIQDHIERIGRMMNEDVPAIADQMRSEMGATQAQSWADSTNQILNSYMEAAKSAKSGMDQAVGSLSGQEQVGGLGDTGELGMDASADVGLDGDMGAEEPAADNVPAAAGPENEPLGRAAV